MSTDDDKPPPKLFGPVFWLMVVLAALCIAAGAAVGFDGPRLFPAPRHTPARPARQTRASAPQTHPNAFGDASSQ